MIYVIVGPTGSGKTDIACQVAKDFNLPIINGDAFQIYKEMNIGTAKIDKNDPLYKNHYLIDLVKPDQSYSVKQYRDDFDKIFPQLLLNNKNTLICGGTGLYIKAALYDYNFPEEKDNNEGIYEDYSNEQLYEMLIKLDPQAKEKIHVNNRKRIIRSLQFYKQNNMSKSDNINSQNHNVRFNNVQILFLNPDREELYQHINDRVDKMFDKGLIEEVKNLLEKYHLSLTAFQGIGYKETIDYLKGLTTLEECKELIKKRSRNYAKRQITFFKHQFQTIEFHDKNELINYIINSINKNSI